MKKLYSTLLPAVKKGLLLAAFFLCAAYVSNAQIYTAKLSGPNEIPVNNSPGIGTAKVTIDGTMMRVEATFSGLVGNTTSSHIHAPTALPGEGTAGVATTTPTFPGFPSGVKAGTYDRTFDMTMASSYNPAYITANGGTPASAFAALKAAMDAGKSYFNIHSNVYPGGEIRGFLMMCPTINVSIPDAYALASGVLPNTVYPAYAPASSLQLTASASGGTGPYTYMWSNGSTTASTTVSPVVNTLYTVTVMDNNNCPGMATKTVSVMDVSGGKKGDKIVICHKGKNSLTIEALSVADHLEHGDMLGSCPEASVTARQIGLPQQLAQEAGNLSVRVLSNPAFSHFDLQINGKAGNTLQVRTYDIAGRMIETRSAVPSNQTLRLGTSYHPGVYIVEIVQGAEKQVIRLVKGR
jgi:hypothetical protein